MAGGRLTVDLILQIGDVTEKIEVTSTGETVNTISGEISRTIDSQQVQSLALNERNYAQLISFIPGAVLTGFDQTALTTGMSTTGSSVNGLRADGNLFTVDGGFNMDSGSNATQLDNVGIDFIREVSVQTSNYSAEYGRNDGASVNVVTKSGGDKFHGSLFEYVRNDIFDAAFASAKLNAAPGAPSNTIKGPLRYNDFGWSFGGPIKRSKLFFFAGQEWKVLRISVQPQNLTLPTTAELAGNFSALLSPPTPKVLALPPNAPAGCTIVANSMRSEPSTTRTVCLRRPPTVFARDTAIKAAMCGRFLLIYSMRRNSTYPGINKEFPQPATHGRLPLTASISHYRSLMPEHFPTEYHM